MNLSKIIDRVEHEPAVVLATVAAAASAAAGAPTWAAAVQIAAGVVIRRFVSPA